MTKSKIAVELGRKGGKATLKKKGTEHFKALVKLRWKKHKTSTKTAIHR